MSKQITLALLVSLFSLLTPVTAQIEERGRPLVTVRGSAEIKVAPDLIDIRLALETRGKDLKALFAEQEAMVSQIRSILVDTGVEERDIQTDYVSIAPAYDEQKGGLTLIHYGLTKALGITLRKLDKYDALMTALLAAGVNHVSQLTYRHSEQRKHRDQARAMAVTAAREKASAMARQLGREIGQVFSIEEEELPPWAYASGTNVSNASFAPESPDEVSAVGLAFGQISFKAKVKVSFELR